MHFHERPRDDEDAPDLFGPPPGLARRDGIADANLSHFRAAWRDKAITKEDLFHYVYGLLHSPDYRALYADNLRKELPRIPAVPTADWRAFRDAGRDFAALHLGYEEAEPFATGYAEGDPRIWIVDDPAAFYRVERMRFAGKRLNLDRTSILYNARITLTGIPKEAYRYVVNGKSAIEHVMERQSVSTDKASGIVNDANRFAIETMGDSEYPLLLLRRVITVSLETMRIVDALPPLRLTGAGAVEVGLLREEVDRRLLSHCIPPDALRADNFEIFLDARAAIMHEIMMKLCGGQDVGLQDLLHPMRRDRLPALE